MAGDVEDQHPELDIAVSLIEESKEELEQTVKFWTIVHHAREAELVDDAFVESLMKQGLSANSNAALLSVFIDRIKEKELWFNRFLNVLSDSARYRRLAKQLSRNYHERLAVKKGTHPSLKLLEILHKAVETLKRCKAELQDALERHGQVSVQHCVDALGLAVDHLQSEVRSTEARSPKVDDKPGLVEKLKVLPSKTDHVQSTHPPRVTRDQSSSQSLVVRSKRHKSRAKDDSVTAQHPERSQWEYSEVQVVHEVLKRNRGYLELKIPIDAIIPQLHAQDLLLDYEYAEVTSQPFPIKKNRSLIDAFLKKAPSIFYQFCSILEGQHGYEYIAHHLLREVRDLDPNIPLEDKMKTFGITWSPGPKRSGPPTKDVPQTVDALVDGDLLKKSMQSIIDKQMEMAEDVKRVHQIEVSQLKETVSEAKDKVDVVKAECTALVQQMEQGKVDSSGHVSALQGKIQEIIQACEDVQTQKSADEDSSFETLIRAMNLERRIGQLTTALEEKERELQIWKGTAERREEMLLESRSNYSDLEREHKKLRSSKEKEIETLQNKWETSQETTAAVTRELLESRSKYSDLEREHKELRNNKEKEINSLQNKWETSQETTAAVTNKLSASQERYKSLVAEHEKLSHQHKELRQVDQKLRQEHAHNVAKHEKMIENSGQEIKELKSKLERMSKENSELRLLLEKEGQNKNELNVENCMSNTSKEEEPWLPPWEWLPPLPRWLPRGYYDPRELSQVDADKELQEKATNGEHLVWKEEGDLKLGIWQDGMCYHLQIYQKQDEVSRASYSLDKKVYFESISKLCKHYKEEPLPGYHFKLCWL